MKAQVLHYMMTCWYREHWARFRNQECLSSFLICYMIIWLQIFSRGLSDLDVSSSTFEWSWSSWGWGTCGRHLLELVSLTGSQQPETCCEDRCALACLSHVKPFQGHIFEIECFARKVTSFHAYSVWGWIVEDFHKISTSRPILSRWTQKSHTKRLWTGKHVNACHEDQLRIFWEVQCYYANSLTFTMLNSWWNSNVAAIPLFPKVRGIEWRGAGAKPSSVGCTKSLGSCEVRISPFTRKQYVSVPYLSVPFCEQNAWTA